MNTLSFKSTGPVPPLKLAYIQTVIANIDCLDLHVVVVVDLDGTKAVTCCPVAGSTSDESLGVTLSANSLTWLSVGGLFGAGP